MKTSLICMSFDGTFEKESKRLDNGERTSFASVQEAWEHSYDLGSKWFFFPFHFVTTPSTKTIRAAPTNLEFFEGWRTSDVSNLFQSLSDLPEAKGMDADQFLAFVFNYHESHFTPANAVSIPFPSDLCTNPANSIQNLA